MFCMHAMELIDARRNPKVASEALDLANAHFRAISSLQEIVVEVYEEDMSDFIRRESESHRWKISAVKYLENWKDFDESFSDLEFECDDYYYDMLS